MTHFFLIMFIFVCEYYRTEEQERFCMFSILPLHLAVSPLTCSLFSKSLFSPRSPQLLFRNSLLSFYAL